VLRVGIWLSIKKIRISLKVRKKQTPQIYRQVYKYLSEDDIIYKCSYRDCKLNHVKQDHLSIVNQERENYDDETTAALEYLQRHDSSSKWILEEWTTINTKLLLISVAFRNRSKFCGIGFGSRHEPNSRRRLNTKV
jgi:hypothetical protein